MIRLLQPFHCMLDGIGVHAGLLVLQPDVLLSGTRVAGSYKCARQAVLEERFGGDSGAKAVEGTLLHDLFQVCLSFRHLSLPQN